MTSPDDSGVPLVRTEYESDTLDLTDLTAAQRTDPLLVVREWMTLAATDDRELEPTAMTLATRGPRGPDARVVLCRGVDRGLVFYTNLDSAKGRQLGGDADAAAVLHWATLQRQVRVRGSCEPVDDATSDAYFAERPIRSQLGAWASAQSEPITTREQLEQALAEVTERFGDGPVPRPPHWGGIRLVPREVELWQGRRSRLHDRLLATRTEDGWTWERLQP